MKKTNTRRPKQKPAGAKTAKIERLAGVRTAEMDKAEQAKTRPTNGLELRKPSKDSVFYFHPSWSLGYGVESPEICRQHTNILHARRPPWERVYDSLIRNLRDHSVPALAQHVGKIQE